MWILPVVKLLVHLTEKSELLLFACGYIPINAQSEQKQPDYFEETL